jgi:hypothetical protein
MEEKAAVMSLAALAQGMRLRIFRAIYAITALQLAPQAFRGWLNRRRQVGVAVSGDTLQPGNP